MAPEWSAWLRHKRVDPPDETEIKANADATTHRQVLARQLQAKYDSERDQMIRDGLLHSPPTGSESTASSTAWTSDKGPGKAKVTFPVRPELETVPGEGVITGSAKKSDNPS
ncbi:unnamed protein product [Echinostoma caproni]|uniref:NADH dehydrogenase [ubiquinone] 1 alpha subcomplex assembly factor 2 n=1 Tax=Echinostoma caproni TaxID=27848 RepID=A0A183AYB6_9TREM|nr:unnamed protein product [Echinostoma caproni]